ncbi:MAG: preprotein translocase subunit SecE [Candidatus Abawacabacteria bacterium]|nr:preprotein translocase subunit SecE [Candidatus Abawacabacteria bacterium]
MIRSIHNYVSSSVEELRKVAWPTRSQAINSTIVVLSISLVMLAFIALLDFLFSNGYKYLSDFLTGV